MSTGEIVIICILLTEWVRAELRLYLMARRQRQRCEQLASVTQEQWRAAVAQTRAAGGVQ